MGKVLGYIAIAGLVWLTYQQIQKAKKEENAKLTKK